MTALDTASAIDNVKTMLKALTAWQTICNVATAAEAAERIYKGGVEENPAETLAPCIILDTDAFTSFWQQDTSRGELPVEVRCELAVPNDECGTYQEQYVWVWEQLAALMAGINGAVNGGGQLMMRNMDLIQKPGAIDPDDNQGRVEWGFVIQLTLDFI